MNTFRYSVFSLIAILGMVAFMQINSQDTPRLGKDPVKKVIAAMTRNDRQQRRYSGLKLRLEQGEPS